MQNPPLKNAEKIFTKKSLRYISNGEHMTPENKENALNQWLDLVNEAESISLSSDDEVNAKKRAEIVNNADELFYSIAEYEKENPIKPEKPLNVFAPCMPGGFWTNSVLARDKGYTPYFLSRVCGGRCVFFFCDEDDPLPVSDVLEGAEFVRKKNPAPKDYETFIRANIDDIDILVTDDLAGNSFNLIPLFKSLKPNGKALHITDINRFFYKINADEAVFGRFGDNLKIADVYTAASHIGRDIMNADPRLPKPVYFNSNAYLPDKNADYKTVTAKDKENIILAAGRIGSEHKRIDILIRAFAHLSNDFPDWKLVLAGPYTEPEKKKIMNDALRGIRFSPEIFNRIIFTGGLNKPELYKYYKKAKIMALTSPSEGGTPNVFSEALAYGCFMVIPDRLDGAPEMTTAFGRNIGMPYATAKYTDIYDDFSVGIDEKGEAISLANALAFVIPNLTESFYETHINKCREYLEHDFDYKKNSIKLLHLLCR
jgi:glycosyltransferase involved in cell wall biosynthesis